MKKKDVKELFEKMDWEGADYALFSYSDWKEIKDPKFHKLLEAAKESRDNLNAYLMTEAARNNVETDIEL